MDYVGQRAPQQTPHPLLSSMSRRKSTVSLSFASRGEREATSALELERLEQETTLVLQEIDHNLSRANAVINDKMFPILRKYAAATTGVWENAGFWKHFMEEAADVEIKTVDDSIERVNPDTPKQAEASPKAAEDSPPGKLEASTPQQPRLLPSGNSAKSGSRGRSSVSPSKSARSDPRARDEARRLSIRQNFLNSSPTLPEPPVLMSELGRGNAFSSSSTRNRRASSSSEEQIDQSLGRLLPIQFSTVTLTPGRGAPDAGRKSNTPLYGSSALRTRAANANDPASIRRTEILSGRFQDDSDIPVPRLTVLGSPMRDASDELAPPQLQSVLRKHALDDESIYGSPKRRKKDSPQNVFLDTNSPNSKNTLTLYHTLTQEPRDPESRVPDLAPNAPSTIAIVTTAAITTAISAEEANSPEGETKQNDDLTEETRVNVSQSTDHSGSAELGSVLGERWRAISRNLRS